MARPNYDKPAYFINREASWLEFNWRVLEEAEDENNPPLERLKFLSITASNLDEFFEVRVAGVLQRIEDGHLDYGPDGLLPEQERELIAEKTHEFVEAQYACWNQRLRPSLAENGIRILEMQELDTEASDFVNDFYEREVDPLLTPVTIDPAHPFPRVLNKALCFAFLLRRRRRASSIYMGVVTIPRALPRLLRIPAPAGSLDFVSLGDLIASHAATMVSGAVRRPARPGAVAGAGGPGAGRGLVHRPVLLLPLLLLPAQLLAEHDLLAGEAGRPVRAPAGVHGVPAVPRGALALRVAGAAELLPRVPLLAGRVLMMKPERGEGGGQSAGTATVPVTRSPPPTCLRSRPRATAHFGGW